MKFWTSHILQLVTLASVLGTLVATPIFQRKNLPLVPVQLRQRYLRICNDIIVQVALNIFLPLALSLAAVLLGPLGLSEAVATTFLGICTTSGASALWNVRKAHIAYKIAIKTQKLGSRTYRLSDVYKTNVSAFTAALISLTLGVLGLLITYVNFSILPDWFWFVCFLMSAIAIYATSWSIVVQIAAEEYENNPKLGTNSKKYRKK
ncbi:hypothetical protein KW842_26910 [Duganella sp. sic0402]|uniref:hypothetical protein n=1 Tax=Duganella sp. sic0402 TaxID=2854786 RepID=UPI001C47EF4E|nr:hypothetical protein [Duganella sp. sic0402]MBV7539407.1 hypothetical protein [Duganella sp. sic0402]